VSDSSLITLCTPSAPILRNRISPNKRVESLSMSLHHPPETTDVSLNISDFLRQRDVCHQDAPKRKHRKLVCILSLHHSSCLVRYPPTITYLLHPHPSSNNTVSLLRRWSLRSIIHRITSPLRLIAVLRLLQLIRIVSIVAIITVEGRACSLVGDRWFVGRSCAAVVGLVWVISSIISVLLTDGRLVTPVSSHPASSVHGGHAATTATATVVAPVNWGQWGGRWKGREEHTRRGKLGE
jgi:hypothetical protein